MPISQPIEERIHPTCTGSMNLILRYLREKVLRRVFYILITGLLATAVWGRDLSQAEDLFKRADYEGSLAQLEKSSSDGPTLFLIGRDYLMSGDLKKASEFLERAVAADSSNSDYYDWLGRAYGKRAETSNILAAPGWATKARQAFEKSVQLDPKNSDALDDLFDYYLDAPGFMGGGMEKAARIAAMIAGAIRRRACTTRRSWIKKRRNTRRQSSICARRLPSPRRASGILSSWRNCWRVRAHTHESRGGLPHRPKKWLPIRRA